ncbi:DNA cross-link repair 1a protein [Plakobranchus ocellatus]|uniref:DNA cross-link repair 1A protein n=1 Tax=Plakobranchus ocellatus TaxID=259542 RepID=A0AAV4E226_9GAST|nr:DNA cross-link repair 1a protein [Plakobranchus ocellatus]
MPNHSDSSEGDIWNYQPAKRKRDKFASTLCISGAEDCQVNKVNSKGLTCRKVKSAPKPSSMDRMKKQDECIVGTSQKQVIDVDLVSDSEFSSSKTSMLFGSPQNLDKCLQKGKTQISSQSGSQSLHVKKTSQMHSESQKLTTKKRSYNQSTSKPNNASPARKAKRISESKGANKEKTMPTIETYFSPKKQSLKTAVLRSNVSNNVIDLSDDEFLNLDTETKTNATQSTINSAPHDDNIILDKAQTKRMSGDASVFSTQTVQKYQPAPSVDVHVIHDEESEQSSFESENRSTFPIVEENHDFSEILVNGNCNQNVKVFNKNRNALVLSCKTDDIYSKDTTVSSLTESNLDGCEKHNAIKKTINEDHSSNIAKEGELAGGFLVDEDSSDTEKQISEQEEILDSYTKPKGNEDSDFRYIPNIKSTSNLQYSQSSNELALDFKEQDACTSIHSQACGGFLPQDIAVMTDDVCDQTENNSLETQTEPDNSGETCGRNRTSLLSSASWPNMTSSATKQTTLFSFLKAKPSSGTSTAQQQNPIVSSRQRGRKSSSITSLPSSSSTFPAPMGNQNWHSLSDLSDTHEEKSQRGGKKKACPFYKKIPGTTITVDAFRYGVIPGCEAYVLTHFHYDHYGGLTKKFAQPLFCSKVTGNLVESRIGVDKKWINCLPMWKPCKVAGITVTLMEANHCPGAVLILFELKDGRKILHTGDFRASTEMETYSALQGIRISELYLDTTYCNPSYAFPNQSEVISFVVDLVLKYVADHPSTLIVCGAYTIGKERIFAAIAEALDSKICVMNDKKKVLDCLEDTHLKSRVTLNWSAGRVHVLPMGKLNQQQLWEHHARHPHFENVLAFQPTGWTHSDKHTSLQNLKPKWSKGGITLYGVPYSEHSSFLELKRFVQHFQPLKILPTVNNGSPASRNKMEAIFKEWMQEKKMQSNNID